MKSDSQINEGEWGRVRRTCGRSYHPFREHPEVRLLWAMRWGRKGNNRNTYKVWYASMYCAYCDLSGIIRVRGSCANDVIARTICLGLSLYTLGHEFVGEIPNGIMDDYRGSAVQLVGGYSLIIQETHLSFVPAYNANLKKKGRSISDSSMNGQRTIHLKPSTLSILLANRQSWHALSWWREYGKGPHILLLRGSCVPSMSNVQFQRPTRNQMVSMIVAPQWSTEFMLSLEIKATDIIVPEMWTDGQTTLGKAYQPT